MLAAVSAEGKDNSGVVYWALNGYGVSAFEIVVNTILLTMAGWIIVLNALVLDTLVRVKGQTGGVREPADWLVSSLSVADMVTGVFLIYHSIYNFTNFQIRVECLVRNALLNVALYSSVFHLCLLTGDRYIKIISPYRYDTVCNNTTVAIFTAITWTISLALSLMPTLGWSNEGGGVTGPDGEELPVCSFFGLMHPDYLRLSVSLYFIPFATMIVLYVHIFKVASRHARVIAAQEGSRARERHSWKYTKTVVFIMGLYFVSWLPTGVVIILHLQGHLDDYTVNEKGNLLTYCSTFSFANSVVNPIVYAVKVSVVRARFRAIFCRGRPHHGHSENSVTLVATVRGSQESEHYAKVKAQSLGKVTETSIG